MRKNLFLAEISKRMSKETFLTRKEMINKKFWNIRKKKRMQ